ncbi:uncharacterized protein LOC143292913 [Babylonia areolata]|uniref:uncharacterized protein LOC143292913 n=1 Tax=Babylonia areolata TaxID=304850 RepID=UPI003FD5A101
MVSIIPLIITLWSMRACFCYGDTSSTYFLKQLPWETRDHLLQLQPHLNIMQLTGSPIPMYRPDMGDQIAYWLINYDHHHYAIVSAGQHTGDSMLQMQGEGPFPVSSLQEQARSLHNSTCLRYLVLTPSPDLNLACDTAQGRLTLTPLAADVNITSLWEEMKRKGQHDDGELGGLGDNRVIQLHLISALEPASFPMTGMRDCHIRSLGQSDGSELSVKVLCKLLGVCDERGRVHTHLQTDYGEVYVHLKPVHEDQHTRFEHDLHFEVVGHHVSDGLVIKRFAVEPSHRVKRQASSYTSYSIDESHLMPDYNQFSWGKCQVGCGPVAWAQVFGYYDRRAHLGSGSSASKALYRCGADGTTGNNSCVAPSNNDNRMRNYTGKLNGILRTFCFGEDNGATYQKRMDDVEGFFKQRQGSSAHVILETRTFILTRLVGIYSDEIRDEALSYLRQKWPVIVGFRVSGVFSQHYAVMTKYRTRTIRKKKCFLWWCWYSTVHEYDMFLHMGWGGSSNGWRKAEMFMAVVAKY